MVSRINGHAVSESALAEAKAQAAITKRTLKTAEPTIVPVPTSLSDINTPKKCKNNKIYLEKGLRDNPLMETYIHIFQR